MIEGVSDEQRKAIRKEAAAAARQITDAQTRRNALRAALERARNLDDEPGAAPEFVLWRESFEADNFSAAEMCEVIRGYAAEQAGIQGFRLDESEVEAALEERKTSNEGKAIGSVILELAEGMDGRFRLSKPDFARLLAGYALDHPEREGQRRPLLELAEHLVHLTWADRRD